MPIWELVAPAVVIRNCRGFILLNISPESSWTPGNICTTKSVIICQQSQSELVTFGVGFGNPDSHLPCFIYKSRADLSHVLCGDTYHSEMLNWLASRLISSFYDIWIFNPWVSWNLCCAGICHVSICFKLPWPSQNINVRIPGGSSVPPFLCEVLFSFLSFKEC